MTRKGFTFIEILATMAMLGIVLPAVMNGISLSLSAAALARQQSQAAALAHSKLMELVAEKLIQHGNLSGDFGPEQPEFRWAAQSFDWEGSTLRQVDVVVYWQQAGRERTVAMSTLLYLTDTGAGTGSPSASSASSSAGGTSP